MSGLSDSEKLGLAAAFAAASRTNDQDAYVGLCAPGATSWHNFDQRDCTVAQSLRTIAWLHRTVRDLGWRDVAVQATAKGWVHQSVMTGHAPGGILEVHTCLVVTVDESGRVCRVEEYLDPAQTAVLLG